MVPKSPQLQNFILLDNKVYREAFMAFMCNGILFNHESPRRGEHLSQEDHNVFCQENIRFQRKYYI